MADTQTSPPPSFNPPAEPEWHRMIAVAAYFRAEKRGFSAGQSLEDWLLAEQDIKELIAAGAGRGS